MRLWSLHPKYLDAKGIVALWREGLLAKHVLEGKTKGYTMHPQLERFKLAVDPLAAINFYLKVVYDESCTRGYCFTQTKINVNAQHPVITVTTGQLEYEWQHLLKKLALRDPERYNQQHQLTVYEPHPLFTEKAGPIENWEVIT